MNVDDAWRLLHAEDRTEITIFTRTSKGRRTNVHTIVGGPGNWLPFDNHLARAGLPANILDWRRLQLTIDRMMESALDTVRQFEDGHAPLREDVPWPVLSMVCDVVHQAGRRSVSVEQLKAVASQHGRRIMAVNQLPAEQRQHAVAALQKAIASAVVLPLRRR